MKGRVTAGPSCVSLRAAAAAIAFATGVVASFSAHAEDRALKLYNLHTKERATIVFKRDGKYDKAGLAKVNSFLRDWRRNETIKMDPNLLDLVWTAYQKSGATGYINIICGYRSPATNGMLRKRSSGVAQNSQHTKGRAMDFFIEGVPLAQLRAIGLRMQVGGVGFYPTSGSPFVHMDTGSVRHWPRMTRQQLAKVFPDGKTVHVPSDGKPLPGYAQALAAQKMRSKSATIEVAADNVDVRKTGARKAVGEPVVIASVNEEPEDEGIDEAETTAASAEAPLPVPRFSPVPTQDSEPPVEVAAVQPIVPEEIRPTTSIPASYFDLQVEGDPTRHPKPFEFESASHWNAPTVPAALAEAMAERDVSRPASLPIRPTAVVATIDVARPLRADAMTTAVIQNQGAPIRDVTPVFAYAAAFDVAPAPTPKAPVTPPVIKASLDASSDGIPMPVANPLRVVDVPPPQPIATGSIEPLAPAMSEEKTDDLTLTALDTMGLRQWIGTESTRQRQYAMLTMPDFASDPSLLDKPKLVYSAGFHHGVAQELRTDTFSGPTVQLPTMIDLTPRARLAFR
jgi:uncharacterized protein YcbK (DUF882 family)